MKPEDITTGSTMRSSLIGQSKCSGIFKPLYYVLLFSIINISCLTTSSLSGHSELDAISLILAIIYSFCISSICLSFHHFIFLPFSIKRLTYPSSNVFDLNCGSLPGIFSISIRAFCNLLRPFSASSRSKILLLLHSSRQDSPFLM